MFGWTNVRTASCAPGAIQGSASGSELVFVRRCRSGSVLIRGGPWPLGLVAEFFRE